MQEIEIHYATGLRFKLHLYVKCNLIKIIPYINVDLLYQANKKAHCMGANTLLKSNVTGRDQVVRCRGSQECGSCFVTFRL